MKYWRIIGSSFSLEKCSELKTLANILQQWLLIGWDWEIIKVAQQCLFHMIMLILYAIITLCEFTSIYGRCNIMWVSLYKHSITCGSIVLRKHFFIVPQNLWFKLESKYCKTLRSLPVIKHVFIDKQTDIFECECDVFRQIFFLIAIGQGCAYIIIIN